MASSPDSHQLRLTLRTLLAYLDDTLPPADAKHIGQKLAESPAAQDLVERIKRVTRRRGLSTPPPSTYSKKSPSDPNVVADYLSDSMSPEMLAEFETICLESDIHLAEVAACHQILTLVLCEQMRVPPTSYQRMYALVKGRESIPTRLPGPTIPVGGAYLEPPPAEPDDADAPYLLGLPAYSNIEPGWKRASRWAMVGLLALGFFLAVWIVWPGAVNEPRPGDGLALVTPATQPTKPTELDTKPKPPVDPPVKPPVDPPVKPPVDPPVKPPVEPIPMPTPVVELVPKDLPPKAGEAAIGVLDAGNQGLVIAKPPEGTNWKRIGSREHPLMTGQRVVALPGYKARFKLENGAFIEMWGNHIDLLPFPVYESTAMFHVPYDGTALDFTLLTGRVYLSTSQPTGTKMRLRFLNEIWDITLPDARSEVAVEVINRMVPSRLPESPETVVRLFVVKGTAALKLRNKEIPRIVPGELATWTRKGLGFVFPTKVEPDQDLPAYFARVPLYPNPTTAKPMLEALDELAKRLDDPTLVKAILAEKIREQPDVTPRSLADARIGVFAYAAIGDLETLVDLLNDDTRHLFRQTAASTLRLALANHPEAEDRLRDSLKKKLDLPADQIDDAMRMLRGVAPEDRNKAEVLDWLFSGLSAKSLAIRELAITLLLYDVDPLSQKNPRLGQFNAAAPAEQREAFVKAWGNRIVELKSIKPMPPKD